MATFYQSCTDQREVVPNLYIRESGNTYPESSVCGNMMYLNFSSSGPYSEMLTGSNQSQQNCTELPVISQESSMGGHPYNAWRDGRNEMLFMQTNGGSMDGENNLVRNSVILSGQALPLQQSNFSNVQGQGLSLSLGTLIQVPSFKYQPSNSDISMLSSHQSSMNGESCRDDISGNNLLHANASDYGFSNSTVNISNSKYLRVAQQLLDEVVNVQKALKHKENRSKNFNTSTGCKDNDGASKSDGISSNPQEANSSSELSPSERQDLQNKVTKLLAMLDEVDRRYKQYYHQMQIIVSSFDAIAGCGSAKPYTALALQTISRHFRCLRDAISGQIQSTRKILGEQESSTTKGCGISRLRYIDQHLRQQRAMQQLGMMQPHAWRPQRGLPETSVSVLRAWLFEHFLHPYPNDSEKLMLARQTGLTRGQVSNWFINARVRLWKPMVEDMYKEEFGETEMDSNSSSENAAKGREELQSSEDRGDLLQSPASERCLASTSQGQLTDYSKSNLISNMGIGGTAFQNDATADDDGSYMALKLRDQRPNGEDTGLLHDAFAQSDGGRFMAYQMADMGRYGNTGVSLTLGLQNCDASSLAASDDQQQGFLAAVRGEDIYGTTTGPSISYAPNHLLHDFVA
ncbi:BEL1-like homeodomain protein 7 [Iris pallida]|uniref:BEL1-like homeodomain protein 7 n=1 Tax=Iris pallida TaxID=29817 RepID=A0AAX6GMP6_IRIPA|nr:BEL1-like homeodomain protein 7 [Iris pallida]